MSLFDDVPQYTHQSQMPPEDNKFHAGNGVDGKHYWLTPPALMSELDAEFKFDFDPCPFPKPSDFDGLTCEWGASSYVNPPFGSVMHQGPNDKNPKKKGPTAWARKAIEESQKGKKAVLVYPIDKWVLMLIAAGAEVRNLGDVRWCATEDGSQGKGTGRHIACFVLDGTKQPASPVQQVSVPDVSAMARILADRSADACNVNREDNWAIHGQDYIDDVTAMLAAAPAAPAADAWIPVSERLPAVESRLDQECRAGTLSIAPLNVSAAVLVFDGEKVRSTRLEWFDGCLPLPYCITHWMPLPAAPAANSAKGVV